MIIQAKSEQEALDKGRRIYRCKGSELKICTIKEPSNILFGIIKTKGKYRVELASIKKRAISKDSSKDGSIEIVSGKAAVSDPVGEGRYAAIDSANPNVDVYVNGNRVNSVSVVTSKDKIEFKPLATEAVTRVKAELSKDKMKANLTVTKIPGKKYYVEDAPKTSLLKVSAGCKETPAPKATLEQCIQEIAKLKVSPKYVDKNAIENLLGRPEGGNAVVAEGIYPIDGRDGRVKYLFERDKVRNPAFETNEKVALLDHTLFPTVEVGQILAIKEIQAVPGRDGERVTGEVIKAKPAKEIPFKAGKGTMLLDGATKIVASASGRPMQKNGTVSVVPLMHISKDVNPETGNIYFNGDVYIRGSVMDNMKVVANGNIVVSGNVLQATLIAGGGMDITGNIISSKITVGTDIINDLCILPRLKRILSTINTDFYDANSEVWLNGYRKMLGQNPDMFTERLQCFERLTKDMEDATELLSDEDRGIIKGILEQLEMVYAAGGSISARQINRLKDMVQEYLKRVSSIEGNDAGIRLRYAQNSTIQASGTVLVLGRGTYQTDVMAKNAIRFSKPDSVVLGGTLIAGNKICVGVVGSTSGISTHCKVLDKNGKIDAAKLYSNTVITIDNRKKIIY